MNTLIALTLKANIHLQPGNILKVAPFAFHIFASIAFEQAIYFNILIGKHLLHILRIRGEKA